MIAIYKETVAYFGVKSFSELFSPREIFTAAGKNFQGQTLKLILKKTDFKHFKHCCS
jgi:hypothetical protein